MADLVEFSNAFFRSSQSPITLEEAVRLCCSYGALHDFDFQDLIDEGFSDLSDWTVAVSATASVSDGYLELTAGSFEGKWYRCTHDTEVPLGLVASFDWVGGGAGGFFFKGNAEDHRCFLLWWTSAAAGAAYTSTTGVATNLVNVPISLQAPARMQVLARYSLDSVDDERKWVEACLYADGNAIVGFAEDIGGTSLDWDGYEVGFCAYQDTVLRVDNLTISELARPVEWVIIDPGHPPATGMSRAVGTTRVTYMCRYDNTLRVWRPGNRDLDWQPDPGRVNRIEERVEVTHPTHVRVQAAIHEADRFHDADGAANMHRFIIHNDPNIMTAEETYNEAERVRHDHSERARVARFVLPPNYLLEPNDRIYVDGQDWRVITAHTSMQMGETGPRIAQIVEAQRYEELTV